MSIGLIGTKIGMTREFMESGQSVPVTVIRVEKGRAFAQRLNGFEMEVIAYDKYISGFGTNYVKEVNLEEIFQRVELMEKDLVQNHL